MKKFIYIVVVLCPFLLLGQSVDENHVYKTTYQVKTMDGINHVNTQTPLTDDDKIESVTYYDGLGRPKQTIQKNAGGQHEDIITPIVYDYVGREQYQYLPYPTTLTGVGPELPYQEVSGLMQGYSTYYLNKYPNDISAQSPNFYSESRFESSPLNRIIESGAPGEDWKIDQGTQSGHTIKYEYGSNTFDSLDPENTQNDNVIRYYVEFESGYTQKPVLYYGGYFPKNELFKSTLKNENWSSGQDYDNDNTTVEFKNKKGELILKRSFNEGLKVDTYYVYDDFGNLTFVLSPKASNNIEMDNGPVSFNQTIGVDKFLDNPRSAGTAFGYVTFSQNVPTGEVSLQLNLNYGNLVQLKQGPIALLNEYVPDMTIGTYTSGSISYTFSVVDNFLNVVGSGWVNSLTTNFNTPIPGFEVEEEVLNDLCYQYHYDHRNRLVEKKIPGKGWEYIIYDNLDRPVLSQDANLRLSGDWLFTKYDELNRPVYTGMHNYVWPNSNTGNETSAFEQLVKEISSQTSFSEDRLGAVNPTPQIGGEVVYYSNDVLPNINVEIFSVTYYDSFPTYDSDITLNLPVNPNSITLDGQSYSTSGNSKTLVTATKTKVLDTNSWIVSENFYDIKGRMTYNVTYNEHLDIIDYFKTGYDDFTGRVLVSQSRHAKNGSNTIQVTDYFTYDHMGRLLTQEQKVDSEPLETIVANHYDELGQLVKKDVGGSSGNILQSVDYKYNVRGWLTEINDINQMSSDLFAFKLGYSNVELLDSDPLYNGNISEVQWNTKSSWTPIMSGGVLGITEDQVKRGYSYHYDALNRIISANFYKDSGVDQNGFYDIYGITYDRNGNIYSLKRNSVNENYSDLMVSGMDDLIYKYDDGNRLMDITELGNLNNGFSQISQQSVDYDYDENGNLIEDLNKGIQSISYNHLNLPKEVLFASGEMVKYYYDATGVKIEKRVTELAQPSAITYYSGNFIYGGNTSGVDLQFIFQPEGYVEPDGVGGYKYVYQFKDHLGNIRLSYSDSNGNGSVNSSEILEENNYYPFGLKHKGYNNDVSASVNSVASKYMFGGKEYQDELGLGWYDITARNYDPALGRWMNLDPLAELMRRHSPYNYAFNNPLRFIDPDGMSPDDVIINGDLAEKAVEQLNASSDLKITRDAETGKLSATGEATTKADKRLLKAINSDKITVELEASSSNVSSESGEILIGGDFQGSKVNADGTVTANQQVNPNHQEGLEGLIEGNAGKGGLVKHEIIEAFIGAEFLPGSDDSGFETSHIITNDEYSGGDIEKVYKAQGITVDIKRENSVVQPDGSYVSDITVQTVKGMQVSTVFSQKKLKHKN